MLNYLSIMQKIINVLAVASFLVSSAVVATSLTVYNERENIIENVKQQVIDGVSEALPDLMTGALGGSATDSILPESSLPSGLPF